MNAEPLVSVIVLNYKRLNELERCLESILQQDWQKLEIIVVDNHSEEDVAGLVRSKGEAIRLIELPENLGSCAGRNAGIREARGEILVTLDNDVSFLSPFEVSKVVKSFEKHPDFHVLAFRICDAGTGQLRLREWCHPRDWKEFGDTEFETSFFGEGASAFRRGVFEAVGLYWERLFIGHEGYDLTLRMLQQNFRILYCPSIVVTHSMSLETRSHDRPFYIYTRNYVWIAYRHFRLAPGICYLVPKLLMMLFFSLRSARLHTFLRGVRDGLRGLASVGHEPIGKATSAHLAAVEKDRPGWITRLSRHRSAAQL